MTRIMKNTFSLLVAIIVFSAMELSYEAEASTMKKQHGKELQCAYNAGKAKMPQIHFKDGDYCSVTYEREEYARSRN